MRFLVVDDDFQTRTLVLRHLYPYGFVDVATDGEEAIAAFHQALKDKQPYDLITMDILMPNTDGQQALREIRDIEKEWEIPEEKAVKVIMISGLDNNKEVHDAFFLGSATSYIVKPIDKRILLEEIESLGVPLIEKEAMSAV
ncbi:response regulator [Desulfovibrio sp. OttesenSCG-928-I05]|nr:response regulator [Desulfovibrio sp. OttesenSCG-928-I05]